MWGHNILAISVEIKKMTKDDVHTVSNIEKECFAIPWHESAYLTEITNRSAYYIVSMQDGKMTGYAGMWVIMDESHITTIGVAKEYRGKKVGEMLLMSLLDEAMKRGARRATLEVRESNNVAQNLYRKYGFAPAAIRRGYYTDNYENAIVMWIDNMSSASYQAEFRALKRRLLNNVGASTEGVL